MSNKNKFQPSITFLNQSGDITITWEPEKDEEMKKMIKAKMDQGFSFFIVKSHFGTFKSHTRVKNVNQIKDHKVTVHDKDVEKLFLSGGVNVSNKPVSNISQVETVSSRDPEEIVKHNSYAVRPIRGG